MLSIDSMCCRSFVAEGRAVVTRDKTAINEDEVQHEIDRLLTQIPQVSGRNMFARAQLNEVSKAAAAQDARGKFAACSTFVRNHNALFDALSAEEKREYEKEAHRERQRRRQQNVHRAVELRGVLGAERQRRAEASARDLGVPGTLRHIRLSDGDVDMLCRHWDGDDCHGADLDIAWGDLVCPPGYAWFPWWA